VKCFYAVSKQIPHCACSLLARKARARRSANSWDHYVEVMVVTDVKMLQYHQHNLENYVLTLFSTVYNTHNAFTVSFQ
jgi:hypothetical protein